MMNNFYTTRKWKELRKKTLLRDGNKCQSCGTSEPPFLVHHKEEREKGGKDELENLVTLCKSCHMKAHDELVKLTSLGKYNPTDEELRKMGIGW